jgi:hypothetical protein
MKRHAIKFILALLLSGSATGLFSQDTIRDVQNTGFDFMNGKYKNRKSALRASLYVNTEEVEFWETGILSGFSSFGILTNYEFKFAKLHSINSGIKAYITNGKYEYLRVFTSYRFYHNLKKRMTFGKTGENFAANYFFVEPSWGIARSPYRLRSYIWDYNQGKWALTFKKEVKQIYTIWMGYGIQRIVLNNFNIDANFGIYFQGDNYSFEYDRPYILAQVSLGYIIH